MRVRSFVVTVLAGFSAVAVPAAAMEIAKPPRPSLGAPAAAAPTAPAVKAPAAVPVTAAAPAPATTAPPVAVPPAEPAPAPKAPQPAAPVAPAPSPVVKADPAHAPVTVAPKPAPVEKLALHLACKAGRPDGAPAVRCEWSTADGAVRYDLYRKSGESSPAVVFSGPRTAYVDTTVVEGTAYGYGVKAVDAHGRVIAMGGFAFVHCCGDVAPIVKQTIRLTCAAGAHDGVPAVRCGWSAADGAVRYDLYRRSGESSPAVVFSGPGTAYVDTAVVEGTAYGYGVKAFDAGGRVIATGGFAGVHCCTPTAP